MLNQIRSLFSIRLCGQGPRWLKIASPKYMSSKPGYDIKGRVCLITGAASGIGAAVAKALLDECAKGVVLTDANVEGGKKLHEKLAKCYGPERVQFIKCDVLCPKEIEDAFEHTVKCFEQIDIVFNNAGVIQECDPYTTININLTGVIIGTQLAIEKYFPEYRSCREGVIVNCASILGHTTVPTLPTYTSTKHALIGLAKCYGDEGEYKRTQARVMCLCPGFTETSLFTSQTIRPQHQKLIDDLLPKINFQPVEPVAKTTIHMIKCGKPGSSWIISTGKMEEAKIVEAYSIKSCLKEQG